MAEKKETRIPVRLTDDDRYDPNQVHMVTPEELLEYLMRKCKKKEDESNSGETRNQDS